MAEAADPLPKVADPALSAPLAVLAGEVPPAPAWFTRALADTPDSGFTEVEGAAIHWLAWGERGKPGLLLFHGNGAHAGWWRHIAPFLAETHRVVAFSWSGMGRSGHRQAGDPATGYTAARFASEALAVAEATGLFDSAIKPEIVAHSFGGFIMLALLGGPDGSRFRRGTILDTPIKRPDADMPRRRMLDADRPHNIYPDLPSALSRFRLAPLQPCENLYIADMIARESLIQVESGWTWAFDAFLWRDFHLGDPEPLLASARCPLVLMWGDRSGLMPADVVADMLAKLPPGTPAVAIPDADHHVMIDQPLALVAALRALLA